MQTSNEERSQDKLGPLNIANPIQYAAEEYLCAQMFLDAKGISREHDGRALSLVGRISRYGSRDL